MNKTASRLVLVVAVSAIGMFAADNSLGTWKRNIEKSTYQQGSPPANPIVEQITVREAVPGGVKVTTKGKRKDGTSINATNVYKYDGTPTATSGTGLSYDSSSVKQVDENTFVTESKRSGGKYHLKGTSVVSKDGKTMTGTAKGTDAEGKPLAFTVIYDRQ
jgi:hypothetical protein